MKTIKLSPNWTLQGTKIAFAILVLLSVTFLGTSLLLFLLPILLFITILSFLQLLFLHCYKAGICYSRGIKKRYINTEDIAAVEFSQLAFLTIFKVDLVNGKSCQFFNWQVSDEQKIEIERLYKAKTNSRVESVLECEV